MTGKVAAAGEEIVIAKAGKPVAKLEPALLYTADPRLEPYSELVRRI
jgi:antitoxin (DNA-binding transcriptional repressor) of toxin-antitoxin stability system